MNSVEIFTRDFESLKDTDTVAEATRRMLQNRVSDLPVVDRAGKLVGIFKLDRVLAGLLPAAALLGYGVPDLAFVSGDLDALRRKMRKLDPAKVREFTVTAEHVVHSDTSPVEIVLHLYRGANNLPVVEREGGKLVGVVSAREVLAALQTKEKR
jgi:CBS-domain-containing membrane protein